MESKNIPLQKCASVLHSLKSHAKKKLVLVACGSFNPITFLHLRIFEFAKDYIERTLGLYDVIGGIVSPVHDKYGKSGLQTAQHRLQMCALALADSPWISLSSWETEQSEWKRTAVVLDHYSHVINTAFKQHGPIDVKFVCGGDVLESMVRPNVWNAEQREVLLNRFGVVCLERSGFNADQLIFHHDVLYQARHNIISIPQHIENNISSSAVRLLVSRGLSIKYLVPDLVIAYIERNSLYGSPRLPSKL